MKDLFQDFNPVSLEQWQKQLEKDLKGITFSQLSHTDANGIIVNPFYNDENSRVNPQPVFSRPDWKISMLIDLKDEKSANRQALQDLSYGANSLVFPVNQNFDPASLLDGISIEHIQLNFVFTGTIKKIPSAFFQYVREKKLDEKKLSGAFIFDPVSAIVFGNQDSPSEKWKNWKELATHPVMENTGFTPFVTDTFSYHSAGACSVTELACILSHMNEQLNFISENKIDTLGKNFLIVTSVSAEFFESVAKLRALRKLAEFLLECYGMKNKVFIHASNSLINKTVRDPHNNLLRSAIEGMAAVVGGAETIGLFPFDFVSEKKDPGARRWAINQQLIFKDEAWLEKVSDMGAGSFFIEEYTRRIAEVAWKEFQEIEKTGGIIQMALNGALRKKIYSEREKLKQEYSSGKKILLGVNKFRNEKEIPSKRSFYSIESEKGFEFFIAEEIIEKQLKEGQKEHA